MGHPAWYASRVSIPFIAGQWSLPVAWEEETWLLAPQFQSPSLRGSGRFTTTRRARARARWGVSIPFIAGQWSLPLRIHRIIPVSRAVSIPFIAGQWSLPRGGKPRGARLASGFNPLHCGAVVASLKAAADETARADMFQSPSLRGSGRFSVLVLTLCFFLSFQSPSLRGSGRFDRL